MTSNNTPTKGKRYTEEQKAELLQKYRASGESINTFANKNGISNPTLTRWLKEEAGESESIKGKHQAAASKSVQDEPQSLAEVIENMKTSLLTIRGRKKYERDQLKRKVEELTAEILEIERQILFQGLELADPEIEPESTLETVGD